MPRTDRYSIGVHPRSSAVLFALCFLTLGPTGAADGSTPLVGYDWEYSAADETHGNFDRLLSLTYPARPEATGPRELTFHYTKAYGRRPTHRVAMDGPPAEAVPGARRIRDRIGGVCCQHQGKLLFSSPAAGHVHQQVDSVLSESADGRPVSFGGGGSN